LQTWRPIFLSRDQRVDLELLSYIDVAFVVGLLSLVAAVGVVLGRRRIRKHRLRGRSRVRATVDGRDNRHAPVLGSSSVRADAVGTPE
jgi:hypothetical protein